MRPLTKLVWQRRLGDDDRQRRCTAVARGIAFNGSDGVPSAVTDGVHSAVTDVGPWGGKAVFAMSPLKVGRVITLAVGVLALLGASLAVGSSAEAATPSWSIASSPSPGTQSTLYSVSCVSATSCKAVGYYATTPDFATYQSLIESWNGTAWSVDSSPSPVTANALAGVSCVSATSCKAVGGIFAGATLIESWNGTAWSVDSSPSPGTNQYLLNSVSCASATSCKAVGYYTVGVSNLEKTFIESWNGTAWSITPSPTPKGPGGGALSSVSCVSATSCKAVGGYDDSNPGEPQKTLIESWNGTTWLVTSSPNRAVSFDGLNGVSCASATSCKAVGFSSYGPVILSWNGTAWSIQAKPPSLDGLYGVSCPRVLSCKAVGEHFVGSVPMTFIESYAWF